MLNKTTSQVLVSFAIALLYLPTQVLAQDKENSQNYKVINETVRYIYPNDSSHQIRIFGMVLDENNDALPFVTIQIDTFRIGTVTDFDGYFDFILHTSQIPVWNPSLPLKIGVSYAGFETQNFQITIPDSNTNAYPVEINAKLKRNVIINGF